MNEDKFVCYGTFDKNLFECMIRCPYRNECESLKQLKELNWEAEHGRTKTNEDEVLS